ncbi:NrfD/PsrC family molybdoenzyme membrane anchor subunit [Pyrobaculum neutrophilum]|uniref:Polysulphide reductase NrfD n=1 Tax=Pyrobaculum neutrophilum (strain DSM 2338 / JCM 9278 / NBRC 100436 / V24Sta) TaxID=444157 RepID=B1YBG4_PYRNV|nr:NrfD/PsrC family molybdoenzyme membrane anchor subunit [Pyrobaculum neutrophilum]ACB40766.1 conserved hypothetical protein [Pyrobaculum neutrophilum V24Sta]
MKPSALLLGMLVIGVILTAIGIWGWFMRYNNMYAGYLWSFMVITYAFFAASATGSSLVTAMHTVFGYNGGFKKVARYLIAISLITALPAFPTIIGDLLNPSAFMYMFTSVNPESRMAWMGILYVIYSLILLIELILEMRHKMGVGIGIFALAVQLLTLMNLGAIFGSSYGVPAWYGVFSPVLFVAAAFLLGFAFQIVGVSIAEKVYYGNVRADVKDLLFRVHAKGIVTVLLVFLFLLFWYFAVGWFSPPVYVAQQEMFNYSLWTIVLGGLVSLALASAALAKRSLGTLVFTSLVLIVVVFTSLIYYVLYGQIGQAIWLYDFKAPPDVLKMTVEEFFSQYDWMPALMSPGLWLLLYPLAVKLLALKEDERPRRLFILR